VFTRIALSFEQHSYTCTTHTVHCEVTLFKDCLDYTDVRLGYSFTSQFRHARIDGNIATYCTYLYRYC